MMRFMLIKITCDEYNRHTNTAFRVCKAVDCRHDAASLHKECEQQACVLSVLQLIDSILLALRMPVPEYIIICWVTVELCLLKF